MFGQVIQRLEAKSPTWVFSVLTGILLLTFAAAYLSSHLALHHRFHEASAWVRRAHDTGPQGRAS